MYIDGQHSLTEKVWFQRMDHGTPEVCVLKLDSVLRKQRAFQSDFRVALADRFCIGLSRKHPSFILWYDIWSEGVCLF